MQNNFQRKNKWLWLNYRNKLRISETNLEYFNKEMSKSMQIAYDYNYRNLKLKDNKNKKMRYSSINMILVNV